MSCQTRHRLLRFIILASLTVFSASILSIPVYAKETGNHSTGCGNPQNISGSFTTYTMQVLDHQRSYHVRLPDNYDPQRAYPLIFRWHGSGGDGLSGGLGIEQFAGKDAIIIAGDGLDKTWDAPVDSEELQLDSRYQYLQFSADPLDLLFFDRMLENAEQNYCVDKRRIYSYGFSAGGYFTNLLACERGNVIRASAGIESGPRGSNCKGKVATWLLHDRDDSVIPITSGMKARDQAIARNNCSQKTMDLGNNCVKYQGCDKNPVVWCESQKHGHNIRGDFAPRLVWQFFSTLP